MASGVWGGRGIGCLGARGDKGKPARGVMGMEFVTGFNARGIGELGGLSPGRGLIGSPGLSSEGAVVLRCSIPAASDTARLRMISAGLAMASNTGCCRGVSRIVSLGTGGAGKASILSPSLLLLFLSFSERLRCSSSCRRTASRSRSSSSRVFLRPLSMKSDRALSGSSSYSESEASMMLFVMLGSGRLASSFNGAGGAFLVFGLESACADVGVPV